jgi:hypothetical protein
MADQDRPHAFGFAHLVDVDSNVAALRLNEVFEKVASDVRERFLIGEPANFANDLSALTSSVQEPLHDAAVTFQANLRSAVTIGSLPFQMTHTAIMWERLNRTRLAESIRALKPQGHEPEPEALVFERAQKKLQDKIDMPEFKGWYRGGIVSMLASLSGERSFFAAAEELLRQSAVMIWGAFEVLSGDVVVRVINNNPALASALLSSEATRKYFPKGGLVDVLVEHKFNVASTMGNVLFDDLHFDRLPMIRDVFSVIFSNSPELLRKMADQALWILWQRRHLIVHKRGIIDKTYLSKTGDSQSEGTMLKVGSDYVKSALHTVLDTGAELLKVECSPPRIGP